MCNLTAQEMEENLVFLVVHPEHVPCALVEMDSLDFMTWGAFAVSCVTFYPLSLGTAFALTVTTCISRAEQKHNIICMAGSQTHAHVTLRIGGKENI